MAVRADECVLGKKSDIRMLPVFVTIAVSYDRCKIEKPASVRCCQKTGDRKRVLHRTQTALIASAVALFYQNIGM